MIFSPCFLICLKIIFTYGFIIFYIYIHFFNNQKQVKIIKKYYLNMLFFLFLKLENSFMFFWCEMCFLIFFVPKNKKLFPKIVIDRL